MRWLTDYLTRNRIYSEDRVPQEVHILTGEANRRFGVWQVEPFLKERDQRIYRVDPWLDQFLDEAMGARDSWSLCSPVTRVLPYRTGVVGA